MRYGGLSNEAAEASPFAERSGRRDKPTLFIWQQCWRPMLATLSG